MEGGGTAAFQPPPAMRSPRNRVARASGYLDRSPATLDVRRCHYCLTTPPHPLLVFNMFCLLPDTAREGRALPLPRIRPPPPQVRSGILYAVENATLLPCRAAECRECKGMFLPGEFHAREVPTLSLDIFPR